MTTEIVLSIISVAISLIVAVSVGISVVISNSRLRSDLQDRYKKEGVWKGKVDAFMESTKEQFSNLDKRLSSLEDKFMSLCNELSAILGCRLYKSESPIVLTEQGEILAKEIKAKEWIDRVSVTLQNDIKGLDAYGIQNFCFEYVEKDENQYSEEEKKMIRASAYKRGISTGDVRRVLAIELRDRLLKEARLEAP